MANEKKDDVNPITPGWEKQLYTPQRMKQWLDGDISFQELNKISGPEMLQMAIFGFQQYEQGKYAEAQTLFEALSDLDEKEPYYLIALGAVYLAQDELKKAERAFDKAIALKTTEISAFVNRGEVYLRQGQVLEAAQDFKKAVDMDPEGKDPLSQRARLLAAAALEMLEGANDDQESAKKAPAKKPAKAAPKSSAKPAPSKKR